MKGIINKLIKDNLDTTNI